MQDGFLWCPHCGKPHRLGGQRCTSTGKPLEQRLHRPVRAKKPTRRHPLLGTVISGKYKIVRRIGSGGMGEVFEAANTVLGRQVAIKIVNRANAIAAARLRREAQVIAALRHPNICDVYDVGVMSDGSPFLVLELLVGETLEAHLARERFIAPTRAIALITQILSGLQEAHVAGIIHRDIKPANVVLVERLGCPPLAKILDFGFAKDMFGRQRAMTAPGRCCGTPRYMSPEQLFDRPLDGRSDLFSVGIVLCEALTGQHPFAGASVAETMIRITREPPLPISGHVPSNLARIVRWALEKDPTRRPQSAREMQTALANLDDDSKNTDDTDVQGSGIDSISIPQRAK